MDAQSCCQVSTGEGCARSQHSKWPCTSLKILLKMGGFCIPFGFKGKFMLETIHKVIENIGSDQVTDYVTDQVKRLLQVLDDRFMSVPEMMSRLFLSHRPTFRKNYLHPALDMGLVKRKYPENPKDPRQRYRLTAKGRKLKNTIR